MSFSEKAFERQRDSLRELVQKPDWYRDFTRTTKLRVMGEAGLQAAFSGSILRGIDTLKDRQYDIFAELLAEEIVTLGTNEKGLENWDEERQPIDKIVIHHTSRPPGLSLEKLNAMHLLRLYVPRYCSQQTPVIFENGSPQPIYSGHFDANNRPVFYAYHWLIREDGEAVRLLEDNAIGWHAGDWPINCRSIAICIDDDLTSKKLGQAILDSITAIISEEYPKIPISPITLLGHSEITKTVCPGQEFIGGWKTELLESLS